LQIVLEALEENEIECDGMERAIERQRRSRLILIQSLQAGALVYNDYVKHIEQQQDDRTCLTLILVLCLAE
jgi:hypothetical protein